MTLSQNKNGLEPDHDAVMALIIAANAPGASAETELAAVAAILGFAFKRGAWTRRCPSCHGTMWLTDTDSDGIVAVGLRPATSKPCSDVPHTNAMLRDMGVQSPARHNAEIMAMVRQNAGAGISTHPDDFFPDDEDIDPLKVWIALKEIPADFPNGFPTHLFPEDSGMGEYKLWYQVAAAIRNGLGDSGLEMFDHWCSGSKDYDAEQVAKKYRRDVRAISRITIKTLYWFADRFNPGWRKFYRQLLDNEETTS